MARLYAVLISALLALCAGNAFAQAAYVHSLNGTATATVGATQRALKIGDLLDSGTVVSTGDRSNAVIKFEDGQVMAFAERSSLRIVEYRYNKQRVSDSSAVFNLLRGGLRFISGVIGSTNRNSFRLTAGTATVGIRGTDGSVTFDDITRAVTAAVNAGALAMETPHGTLPIDSGNFATYTPGQSPTAQQPTAQANAAVQQVLNNLAAQLVPINTPVVLRLSALAAAAQADAAQLAAQAAAQPGNAELKTAAQDAAKQAQDALLNAIQAALEAYQEAIKGGAVPPEGAAGTDDGTTTGTSGTPTGSAGSGGGGTSCGASCN